MCSQSKIICGKYINRLLAKEESDSLSKVSVAQEGQQPSGNYQVCIPRLVGDRLLVILVTKRSFRLLWSLACSLHGRCQLVCKHSLTNHSVKLGQLTPEKENVYYCLANSLQLLAVFTTNFTTDRNFEKLLITIRESILHLDSTHLYVNEQSFRWANWELNSLPLDFGVPLSHPHFLTFIHLLLCLLYFNRFISVTFVSLTYQYPGLVLL